MTPDEERGTSDPPGKKPDRFGVGVVVGGSLLYVAATVFFVWPLAHRLDTFLIVSFLFVPAIVGGLLYSRIERSGGWD